MSVEIIAQPHPLRSDAYRATAPVGATLADLLGDAPPAVHAQVNGEIWPRERWHEPLPPGIVNVYAVPQGSDAMRLVAMIAVAAAAPYAAAAMGLATTSAAGITTLTFAGKVVAAGLTVAGALAINALIPPKLPSTPDSSSSTIAKSLTGTRNQANPYGVVPRVYGSPRWYPPLAATPVTEIAGSDQYLRMLLCLGYGPLEIGGHIVGDGYPMLTHATSLPTGTIRIGETDIGEYHDVEWEIGTADQLSLFTQDIHEEAVSAALNLQIKNQTGELVDNISATRTTGPGATEINLDLVFPSGLFTQGAKGMRGTPWVDFTVEYAPTGSELWQSVPGNVGVYHRISGHKKETVRRNIRWHVAAGQYDVRVTRVRSYVPDKDVTVMDATWSALRTVQGGGPAYTGRHVLMALRIRATDQLNGVIDQLNLQTTSVLRVWDGETFTLAATDNPAWHYLDALSGPQLGRPIADSRIHLEQLLDWAQWCAAHGLSYHWVHDSAETMFERLRAIAAAGQAAFSLQDGLFGVVRDDPNAPLVQVITPRNASSFESHRQYRALPHALRVKYIDPDTWTDAERIIYRDGYDASNASIFEDLETQGVVGAAAAWHHGQYYFRQALLRPETFTAQLDWEHLALTRGDRARIAYDSILVGLAWGRITAIGESEQGNTTITLDERVTLAPDKAYAVRIRYQDGRQGVSTVAPDVVGETNTLTLDSVLADARIGDLVLFGEAGKESIDCKVVKIEPGPDFTARVTLVDAAPDIYDYGAPPDYDPGITRPVPIDDIPPPTPTITAVRGDETALHDDADGSLRLGLRVAYVFGVRVGLPALQVEARYRRLVIEGEQDEPWQSGGLHTASGELMLTDVAMDQDYEVQLRSLAGRRSSAWSNIVAANVSGTIRPPAPVESFRFAQSGDTSVLRWDRVPRRDIAGYELRYASQNAPFVWELASPLIELVQSTEIATSAFPPGFWLVGIKAVNTAGQESETAAVIAIEVINSHNAIYLEPQAPAWPGQQEGFVVVDGALELDPALPPDGEAVYTAPFMDMAFIDTVRAWAEIRATAPSGIAGDPRLELRYSLGLTDDDLMWTDDAAPMWTDDDAPMWQSWSAWRPWTVGDVRAELVQFRLRRRADEGPLRITEFTPVLDVPPRTESHREVAVPAEGLDVLFTRRFHLTPAIHITPTGATLAYQLSNETPLGFRIQLFTLAGAPTAGTINWTAATE